MNRDLRDRDICWIADFRDPYVSGRRRHGHYNRFHISVATQLEQRMMRLPDLIIANTDKAAEEWQSAYPEIGDRIRVIWNGYDPGVDLKAPPLADGPARTIVHTGALYGRRRPGPVISSLHRLIRSGRLSESVRLKLVGNCNPGTLVPEEIVQEGLERGWMELHPPVSHAEAIRISQQAHGLLVIQPQSGTQVPGKLFEYIRIGRPILAYIQRHSPIEMILEKCGIPSVCIYPEDSAEAVDAALLRFCALPPGPWSPNPWFLRTFDAAEQTRTLCGYIDTAMAARDDHALQTNATSRT
jgi:hypothetical protein